MEDMDYSFEILYNCIGVRKVEITRFFLAISRPTFPKTRCLKIRFLSFFETPSGKHDTVGNIKITF